MSSNMISPGGHGAVEISTSKGIILSEGCSQEKKAYAEIENARTPSVEDGDEKIEVTKSTTQDVRDMQRMGKRQQLVRQFRLVTTIAFIGLASAAWEIGLFVNTPALTNGGRPNLIYSYIWTFVGLGPVYLSIAEMSSMAAIAGSEYHWVSEFAPESLQKVLSYYTGWTSSMACQAGNASGVFLVGTLAQAIISINVESYTFPPWHATLLSFAAVIFALVGNTYGAKYLHSWQVVVFTVHVLTLLAYIIPAWVNAPRATSKQVWTEFEFSAGWHNPVLSVFIGQLTAMSQQVGLDTNAHIAEEVKDASRTVPKAMMGVYIFNFCLMLPAIITISYHIPSLGDALSDPTTFPTIYVLQQSMSAGWTTVVLAATIGILLFSNMCYLAAVSRDQFAFARDKGFPFSKWIAKIDEKRHIPQNACILTSFISLGLAIIYIGSPVAFYALTSLFSVAILQSYIASIACLLWRRIQHPSTLPPAQFSLGKFGVPINICALTYATWNFFWSFWPQYNPVTPSTFNWASVLFIGTLVIATIHFLWKARHVYKGPVAAVEGRSLHFE